LFSGAYADLTGKPTIPTNNNELTNGAGYLTSYTETDPIWTSEKANYALKTYVDTSISNLVASAPAALNTLNELAVALGNDANFSTTVTTLIGTKEPSITAGTTLQYWRGDKSWQTLPVYTLSGLGGQPLDADLTAIAGLTGTSGFLKKNAADTWSLDTNTYVTTTTAQTISGAKTFSASPIIDGGFATAIPLRFKQYDSASFNSDGYTDLYVMNAYRFGFAFNQGSSNYKGFTFNVNSITLNTSREYTMPNAAGTLALISDIPSLSGYVPYTGATTDVSLGNNTLLSKFVFIEGDGTQGGILSFKQYATSWTSTTNHTNIYATDTDKLNFNFYQVGGGKSFTFNVSGLTAGANRTYTMPDASGTIALTSALSSYVPTSRTLTINGTAYNLNEDRAWTITTASAYALPTASATVLGGIKVGTNLSIDANGVLSSTDTNTWNANTKDVAGYVSAPGAVANKVWKTDGSGNPAWRDDADTTYTLVGLGGLPLNGNAVTATTFSTGRTNYKGVTDNAVAGQLMWKNYGNNHTIFDASASTSPEGGAVNNTNAAVAWSATYPTLMGWNGSSTYGVRVDSARVSDSADSATYARYVYDSGLNGGTVGYKEPSALKVNYATDALRSTYAEIGFYVRNYLTNGARNNEMTFYWVGQAGQPTWLWGSNNGTDIYVYNPSNFSVNYATTAGSATDATKLPLAGGALTGNLTITGTTNAPLTLRAVEPYMDVVATGGSNTAGVALYPTAGYDAAIGNFNGGSLNLVAAGYTIAKVTRSSGVIFYVGTTGPIQALGNNTSAYHTFVNSASDNKSWDISLYGNDWILNESNVLPRLKVLAGGGVYADSFFEFSDKRFKQVVKENLGFVGIESITAKHYIKEGKEEIGYFAQDFEGVLDSAILKDKDGVLSLSYRQVHTAKIAALEKRIAELEAKLK
jgi:hypothetical protein